MIKIAALLSTHNRLEKTVKCLECLLNNKTEKIEIYIVISDSSSDLNIGIELKNKFPNILYKKVNENVFWNKGMIDAWKNSLKLNPDFFLLLNDDTFLIKEALNRMLKEYNDLKKPAIIVGATSQGNEVTYGGRLNNLRESPLVPNNSIQEIKYINGNCVLISKYVFIKVGFLSEKFSHSLGDLDYGLRAKKIGIKSYLSGSIVGECEKNKNIWFNKKTFLERLKHLKSPKGVPLNEYFYFNYVHFGIYNGIKFILSTIIALIFPKLYKLLR